MEINRNNYEEYFLLFADNELTDYEKIEVLKFIRENKDLEDEFKMIQDTVCKPDKNIVLSQKVNLFRETQDLFITEDNYEEIFVLYHDGELNDEEKHSTELFVGKHSHLKKEFDVTGTAKLLPDNSISFPGKKNLYRREKTGKVVPLIFWRSLAAAIFIGFGLWIFQAYYQQPAQLPGIVKNVNPVNKTVAEAPINTSENKPNESGVTTMENQNNRVAEKEIPVGKKEVAKQQVKAEKDERSYVQAATKSTKVDVDKESPAAQIQPDVAVLKDDIKNMAQKEAIEAKSFSVTGDMEIEPVHREILNDQTVQVQPASYIVDPNDKNENYVFYNITTEEFRKSKVGGFLKKVKRIVERNNPISRILSGDDKQIVSN